MLHAQQPSKMYKSKSVLNVLMVWFCLGFYLSLLDYCSFYSWLVFSSIIISRLIFVSSCNIHSCKSDGYTFVVSRSSCHFLPGIFLTPIVFFFNCSMKITWNPFVYWTTFTFLFYFSENYSQLLRWSKSWAKSDWFRFIPNMGS